MGSKYLRTMLVHCAQQLTNTNTAIYYLKKIHILRQKTGTHQVILDADRCIVVI